MCVKISKFKFINENEVAKVLLTGFKTIILRRMV